jgi:hypothetical protein
MKRRIEFMESVDKKRILEKFIENNTGIGPCYDILYLPD